MADNHGEWFAAAGVEVPALEPLALADGVTAMGFRSEGDESVVWWRQLRGVAERTGYWPVLIPSVEEAVSGTGMAGRTPAERISRADQLDGSELLNRPGGTFDPLDDATREDLLDRWPEEARRLDDFRLPYEWDGRPAPVLVALIHVEHGWQIPTVLDYGNWNDCPEPAVHGAVLRHWHRRYGAELVCMTMTGLELELARPPRTRPDALTFAWEYPRYCLDGVDLYDANDIVDLAACLIDASVVHFWWD